ncbi:MAG: hypothetical protein AAGE94_11820 [Acidobacteriota bacterium]
MPIDWTALIETVFAPRAEDRGLAIAVDLPDDVVSDHAAWRSRRELAVEWYRELNASPVAADRKVGLIAFRNARTNNGDLPPTGAVVTPETLPDHASGLDGLAAEPFDALFARFTMILAPTEFSATAPLKLAARRLGFRAASMPRFSPAMVDALGLDWDAVDRRCRRLAALLDRADGASFVFEHATSKTTYALELDLRHRSSTPSGGVLREPGTAGNLPSGETYIVPYEGEAGEASRTAGELPVELDGEVVVYRIEANRAVEVLTDGPVSRREADTLVAEPAYGNLAELGLGVLADFGIRPMGEILLDEKLGLHIAFGRSDHFGGMVGANDFSSPDAVVHIDRVYLPETQPAIRVPRVDLHLDDGTSIPLMRDGRYAIEFA